MYLLQAKQALYKLVQMQDLQQRGLEDVGFLSRLNARKLEKSAHLPLW